MGMFSFVSDIFHGISNAVSSVAQAVSNVVSGVGHTIESVGRSLGTTINAIIKNPLPVIAAVALTVMTSGAGAFAAEAILGADAIGAAAAGNAAAYSAISAAVPAAISSAAVTALQGGNVSQIATAGILAGVGAGMTAGLSASQVIQSMTTDLSPAMAQTLSAATGRGIGQMVSYVLAGKDPLTGFVSGAVTGALSSSLSNGQIADLNKAASNIIGSVGGAASSAGITGGNVESAIASSLVGGTLKTVLGASYNGFVDAKNALSEKLSAFNDQQSKVMDQQTTVQAERTTADNLYQQMQDQVTAYDNAKANNDVAGMTAAANTFDSLKPQYDTALVTATNDSYKFQGDVNALNASKSDVLAQNDQAKAAEQNLTSTYSKVMSDTTSAAAPAGEVKGQSVIDKQVATLSPEAQAAYQDAVKNNQTTTDAFAAAEKVQGTVEDTKNAASTLAQTTKDPAAIAANLESKFGLDAATAQKYAENAIALLTGSTSVEASPNTVGTVTVTSPTSTSGGATSSSTPASDVVSTKAQLDQELASGQITQQEYTAAMQNVPGTAMTPETPMTQNPDGSWSPTPVSGDGTIPTPDQLYQQALDQGYTPDEAKQYAYGNSNINVGINGVGNTGTGSTGPGTNYTDKGVPGTGTTTPAPSTGTTPTPTPAPSTGTTPTPTPAPSTSTTAGTGIKIPIVIPTPTPTPTTAPVTSNVAATSASPAVSSTITDLTPGLTKGSAFKFANEPTFTSQMTNVPQQNPYDYTSQILNAATGGSIEDLKSNLTHGSAFSFAHKPDFKPQLSQQPSQSQTPVDYTQQILNAAQGGLIHTYAEGGQTPETPAPPSPTLHPSFLRGHELSPLGRYQGAHFSGYQQKQFAEGGGVPEGHDPQFFSEGGLNSLENTYVKGPGDGTSDSVAAMLANGEFVIPADVVSKLGNGSNDAGANVLDEFLSTIREHAQNHDPKKLPPESKGPLAYLLQAKRKAG